MKATCTDCQEVKFIQNKKYGLCGECVYKKNHKGKTKQEVYTERSKSKLNLKKLENELDDALDKETPESLNAWLKEKRKNTEKLFDYKILGYSVDEISDQNAKNQELAEQQAREEFSKAFKAAWVGGALNSNIDIKSLTIESCEFYKSLKKRKSIKKISQKQSESNALYKLTCIDMDHTTEPICTGCGKYQGGDVKLSHSHIISREDCKRIGRPELIYDRNNLTYHCMQFVENKGCHPTWENPSSRYILLDYSKNIEYIKSISEELFLKYTKHVE